MEISQRGAITTITYDMATDGREHVSLLQADNHYDSFYCNRKLQTEHLQEAVRRKAGIFFFGDFFDAMQGRFDPRRSNLELRPEYRRDNYYDYVVEDSANYLAPYADNIRMIARGNHEDAVLKNANTDLTERLVQQLRYMHNAQNLVKGGYGGWVRFMFEHDGVPKGSIRLKYFHGSGGEAPVTRGAIQTNRQAVIFPDADVIVNGHSHNSYLIPISRERLSAKGVQYFDVAYHVRVPGYKQSYGDGSGGWEVGRGGVPKPIGCAWLTLTYTETLPRVRIRVDTDVVGPDAITPPLPDEDEIRQMEYCQDGADDL